MSELRFVILYSCDENGELSLREKILLFPLSVTHDLCAPKHLADTCKVGPETVIFAADDDDDGNTDTDTDATSDGGDNGTNGNLNIGIECDTEGNQLLLMVWSHYYVQKYLSLDHINVNLYPVYMT